MFRQLPVIAYLDSSGAISDGRGGFGDGGTDHAGRGRGCDGIVARRRTGRDAASPVAHRGPRCRLATDGRGDALPADRLAELAAAVRARVPQGAEDRLPPRVRTLIRLLRRDALEPAWTLAEDNAAGVVRPTRAQSMWAGGSFASSRLPLPTVVDDDGRAFAWLPGFRDPRWGVPDDVYNIDNEVILRCSLDLVLLRRGVLHLSGGGYLGLLETSAQDSVVVVLNGPDGAEHRVPARRVTSSGRRAPERSGVDPSRLGRMACPDRCRGAAEAGDVAGVPRDHRARRATDEFARPQARSARPTGARPVVGRAPRVTVFAWTATGRTAAGPRHPAQHHRPAGSPTVAQGAALDPLSLAGQRFDAERSVRAADAPGQGSR